MGGAATDRVLARQIMLHKPHAGPSVVSLVWVASDKVAVGIGPAQSRGSCDSAPTSVIAFGTCVFAKGLADQAARTGLRSWHCRGVELLLGTVQGGSAGRSARQGLVRRADPTPVPSTGRLPSPFEPVARTCPDTSLELLSCT